MKNRYEIRGDVTAIFINCKGKVAETLIDTKCLQRAMEYPHSWCGHYSKNTNTFYVIGRLNGKYIQFHRWILDPPKDRVVDHVNRNPLDNRLINLRIATIGENNQNVGIRKDNTSGIRGVTFKKTTSKWEARISLNGKRISLGCFESIEEAKQAVIKSRSLYIPFSKESTTEKTDEDDLSSVLISSKETASKNKVKGKQRGIYWNDVRKMWMVKYYYKGETRYLGYFGKYDDAVNAITNDRKDMTKKYLNKLDA